MANNDHAASKVDRDLDQLQLARFVVQAVTAGAMSRPKTLSNKELS